jgi:alkyldihydroxyacetonephosphate synthase
MTLNDESRSIDKLVTLLGDASRVSTAEETISAHSYDAWPVAVKQKQANERPYAPDIVVSVRTTEEVSKVLSFANEKSIPVTAWGLGSSVVGAPLAIAGGICLDTSMMDQLIEIDERNSTVTAEAGMIGGHLESVLNERGLTLNFSPQSLHRSSIGGWVATRATGQFSSKYGGIEEALVAVEVVLANGEVVQSLKLPRMSVGLKLNDVFIGSDATDLSGRRDPDLQHHRLSGCHKRRRRDAGDHDPGRATVPASLLRSRRNQVRNAQPGVSEPCDVPRD